MSEIGDNPSAARVTTDILAASLTVGGDHPALQVLKAEDIAKAFETIHKTVFNCMHGKGPQ